MTNISKICSNCGHDKAWHYGEQCNIKETKTSPACNVAWYGVPCKCKKFISQELQDAYDHLITNDERRAFAEGQEDWS